MKKLLLPIFLAVVLLSACEKNENNAVTEETQKKIAQVSEEALQDIYLGEFTKELVIYDKTKENSALVKIGTDNEEYFNLISSETLTLLPIKKGGSAVEVLQAYNTSTYGEPAPVNGVEEEEETSSEDESALKVYSAILSTSLTDDVEGIILINNTPNPTKAGWIEISVTGLASSSGKLTAKFIGQNIWHTGHYGLDYKRFGDGAIGTLVSKYRQIRTNDTVEITNNNCQHMIAHLKYKGTPSSVVVEFTY